jgi:hypothetical protein
MTGAGLSEDEDSDLDRDLDNGKFFIFDLLKF